MITKTKNQICKHSDGAYLSNEMSNQSQAPEGALLAVFIGGNLNPCTLGSGFPERPGS